MKFDMPVYREQSVPGDQVPSAPLALGRRLSQVFVPI